MGFDLDKQRSYTLPGGGRGESGYIDFSIASYCAALPTQMVSIYYWNAHPAIDFTLYANHTKDLNMYENRLTVDIGDITNSNVIVYRATMRADVSARWNYELKGW